MTAFKGSLVLIKVGNGAGPEVFTTIGGLQLSALMLANQPLDSTSLSSGAWRQLLSGAGIQSMHISGSGMFTDSAAEELVRGYAFASSVNHYQFMFANGDTASGAFLITSYERSGNVDSEELYAITFESAGTISFTAA